MALGTITIQNVQPGTNVNSVPGALRMTLTNVVGDSSYPTGGSALTAAQLGLTVVVYAITSGIIVGANGPSEAFYNPATSKLLCYGATGEIVNTTSLSTATIQVVAYGY